MRFGIKGIIVKEGKVLLIRRSNYSSHQPGEWDLPGGRLEEGETAFQSHRREVMEETKLEVNIIEPVQTWGRIMREGIKHTGITLLDKYISGEVVLSNEHTEHKWVLPDEIKNQDGVPDWLISDVGKAVEINPILFNKA